jgi:hypothetical protein
MFIDDNANLDVKQADRNTPRLINLAAITSNLLGTIQPGDLMLGEYVMLLR